ncbi:hypothetical protein PG988_005712 [Apiospora saccharicola]
MSAPTSFQFVGSKQHRSTQIPDAEWSDREARLRELHSRMTLSQLMEVMKSEGFIATPRQYNYHFKKWGLQKYGSTITNDEESRILSVVPSRVPTVLEEEVVDAASVNRKRPQSTDNTEIGASSLSSPLVDSSKKVKVDDNSSLQDKHTELPAVSVTPLPNPVEIEASALNKTSGCNDNDQVNPSTSPEFGLPAPTQSENPSHSPTTLATSNETHPKESPRHIASKHYFA